MYYHIGSSILHMILNVNVFLLLVTGFFLSSSIFQSSTNFQHSYFSFCSHYLHRVIEILHLHFLHYVMYFSDKLHLCHICTLFSIILIYNRDKIHIKYFPSNALEVRGKHGLEVWRKTMTGSLEEHKTGSLKGNEIFTRNNNCNFQYYISYCFLYYLCVSLLLIKDCFRIQFGSYFF